MAGLREAFEATEKRRGGRICTACIVIADMPGEDRSFMEKLLADPTISVMNIVRACEKAGYPELREGTLKRHRRGECTGLP